MKWFALLGLLLFLGVAVAPTISAFSNNDYECFITAGIFRERWGRIGFGYSVLVINKGQNTIYGTCFINHTTLSGGKLFFSKGNFTIFSGCDFGVNGFNIYRILNINRIEITLKIEDIIVSKSGYELGPLCILMG